MIQLTFDSRDKIFNQKFGQAFEFPDELVLDSSFYDEVQPIGDVKCVSYTIHDVAEDQQKIEFDINSILDLWNRMTSTAQGSDPRDGLKEAVANGLLPKGKIERLKAWRSFWRADIGNLDPFDNVRSAMLLTNSPIFCGTYWHREWHGVDILPVGKNTQNGHAYSLEGWKTINGEPHLIVEAWLGKKMYMPRATFNEALKPYGMQTWVLSTSEIDVKREKTLIERIKDLMINMIILLRSLIKERGAEPIVSEPIIVPKPILTQPEPSGSLLLKWATAIRDYEGKPGDLSYRNNNAGNLKGVDGKFLKFKTWEDGWEALLDYLRRASTGKHRAYKPDFTLLQFFQVYAPSTDSNNPEKYCAYVCKRLGVPKETQIKNLV